MVCGGCDLAAYCSYECRELAWAGGHAARCGAAADRYTPTETITLPPVVLPPVTAVDAAPLDAARLGTTLPAIQQATREAAQAAELDTIKVAAETQAALMTGIRAALAEQGVEDEQGLLELGRLLEEQRARTLAQADMMYNRGQQARAERFVRWMRDIDDAIRGKIYSILSPLAGSRELPAELAVPPQDMPADWYQRRDSARLRGIVYDWVYSTRVALRALDGTDVGEAPAAYATAATTAAAAETGVPSALYARVTEKQAPFGSLSLAEQQSKVAAARQLAEELVEDTVLKTFSHDRADPARHATVTVDEIGRSMLAAGDLAAGRVAKGKQPATADAPQTTTTTTGAADRGKQPAATTPASTATTTTTPAPADEGEPAESLETQWRLWVTIGAAFLTAIGGAGAYYHFGTAAAQATRQAAVEIAETVKGQAARLRAVVSATMQKLASAKLDTLQLQELFDDLARAPLVNPLDGSDRFRVLGDGALDFLKIGIDLRLRDPQAKEAAARRLVELTALLQGGTAKEQAAGWAALERFLRDSLGSDALAEMKDAVVTQWLDSTVKRMEAMGNIVNVGELRSLVTPLIATLSRGAEVAEKILDTVDRGRLMRAYFTETAGQLGGAILSDVYRPMIDTADRVSATLGKLLGPAVAEGVAVAAAGAAGGGGAAGSGPALFSLGTGMLMWSFTSASYMTYIPLVAPGVSAVVTGAMVAALRGAAALLTRLGVPEDETDLREMAKVPGLREKATVGWSIASFARTALTQLGRILDGAASLTEVVVPAAVDGAVSAVQMMAFALATQSPSTFAALSGLFSGMFTSAHLAIRGISSFAAIATAATLLQKSTHLAISAVGDYPLYTAYQWLANRYGSKAVQAELAGAGRWPRRTILYDLVAMVATSYFATRARATAGTLIILALGPPVAAVL